SFSSSEKSGFASKISCWLKGVDLLDVSWILHVDVKILLVLAEQTPFRRGETPPRQGPASPARGRSPSSPPWRYRSPLRSALD
ncbi:hypothetical protein NC653_004521, partial [Populus alba x Populus x berolinensis]